MREPYLGQIQCRTQIINVPVGSFGNFHMMGDAGFEAAGAEGAADIHVETALKPKRAEFTDLYLRIVRTGHD